MALAKEDLEQIGTYVRQNIVHWLEDIPEFPPRHGLSKELLERMVRVEEELKHQRELMREGFQAIYDHLDSQDKRLDSQDKRFEAIEKRFDLVDKQFEAVDKRFDLVDKRFEAVDKRFEAVDKRFDLVDRRFEAVDRRFESLEKRMFRFMIWSWSITVSSAGIVIAVLKLT